MFVAFILTFIYFLSFPDSTSDSIYNCNLQVTKENTRNIEINHYWSCSTGNCFSSSNKMKRMRENCNTISSRVKSVNQLQNGENKIADDFSTTAKIIFFTVFILTSRLSTHSLWCAMCFSFLSFKCSFLPLLLVLLWHLLNLQRISFELVLIDPNFFLFHSCRRVRLTNSQIKTRKTKEENIIINNFLYVLFLKHFYITRQWENNYTYVYQISVCSGRKREIEGILPL